MVEESIKMALNLQDDLGILKTNKLNLQDDLGILGNKSPLETSNEDDFAPRKSLSEQAGDVGKITLGSAAAIGAGAGAVYLGGKALQKGGNIFSRVGAGLSQKTLDTIKSEGLSNIKSISNAPGEYLAKKVIPEARRNIIKSLVNYKGDTDVLDTIGFKPYEIESLSGISKEKLYSLGNQMSGNWYKLSKNLEKSTQEIGKKINNVYNVAESIGINFPIPKSYGMMRNELRKYGLVDLTGNLTRDAETISSPTLKNFAKAYSEIHSGIKNKGAINIPQYRNLINQLEGSLGQEEQFNIPIYKTIKALRNEGASAINPSAKLRNFDIVKLNKEYSDSVTLQNLGKKINDVINEAPDKLETTFNKLKNDFNILSRDKYTKIYGEKLIKDIDKISAAKELYPETMGGWTRWGSRQLVKGGMAIGEKIGDIKTGLKQLPSKISSISEKINNVAGKTAKVVMPVSIILDAFKYADDPQKYLLNLYNVDTENLAPVGSKEREEQLSNMNIL